jgi:hypothetical protein
MFASGSRDCLPPWVEEGICRDSRLASDSPSDLIRKPELLKGVRRNELKAGQLRRAEIR